MARRKVLAKAKGQVKLGRADSLSAWADEAIEEKSKREDLVGLLAAMKAENGPASAAEEAWARGVLRLKPVTAVVLDRAASIAFQPMTVRSAR